MDILCPSRSTIHPSPPWITRLPSPLASSWPLPMKNKLGKKEKSEVRIFILLFPTLRCPFEVALSLHTPWRPALYNSLPWGSRNLFSLSFLGAYEWSQHHMVSFKLLWLPVAPHTFIIYPCMKKCSSNLFWLRFWDKSRLSKGYVFRERGVQGKCKTSTKKLKPCFTMPWSPKVTYLRYLQRKSG